MTTSNEQTPKTSSATPKAPKKPARSLEEAHSECLRELNVRERCYPKWVQDGRLTGIDAKDRLERMEAAVQYLAELVDATTEVDPFDHTIDPADVPPTGK